MTETATCPGCHIECSLEDPQCTRGLEVFRPMWLRGEELPQRKGGRPPFGPRGTGTGSAGRDGATDGCSGLPRCIEDRGKPPVSLDEKLAFLLTEVLPRSLSSACGGDRERLLAGLVHQGGGMSCQVMPERARVDARDLADILDSLVAEGLVTEGLTKTGSRFYWVTEKGRLAAGRLEAARKEAIAERFSALGSEEKQQLELIVEKLLAAGRPRA